MLSHGRVEDVDLDTNEWPVTLQAPVSPDRDHIRGPDDAPVTVVEYGDYECRFCGAAHLVSKALQLNMGQHVRYAFRHFPMTTIHPHSARAAEVAEAAGRQGRFWLMHDILFENQCELSREYILGYAKAINLDMLRFRSDLAHHVHAGRIREDFLSGVRSGVHGTPTFYVNGIRHDGAWTLSSLRIAVERARSAPIRVLAR